MAYLGLGLSMRPVNDYEVTIADGMSLSVLDLSVDFMYTIPSFSVIHVSLRQGRFYSLSP